MLEVSGVACGHGEPVYLCDRRDHGVLDQHFRPTAHELSGFSCSRSVKCEDRRFIDERLKPNFHFKCFGLILLTGYFQPGLYFVKSDRWERKRRIGVGTVPIQQSSVRSKFPQFGDDVCVEQENQNFTGLRIFHPPRGGIFKSPCGPDCRTSRRVRFFACRSRSQSPKDDTTALFSPRCVMICGPSFLAVSITSLSFAFASCSCHVPIALSRLVR